MIESLKEENKRKGKVFKFLVIAIFILAILIIIGTIVYAKIKSNENNIHIPHGDCNSLYNGVEVDKPIIYLYPTKEQKVSVKLENSNKITCSYPKYQNGWNVIAKPNGDLVDLDTKRNLYSLYYESTSAIDFDIEEDGFIVKGTDIIKFLEEKLEILGLSQRETEEFIVYWLPKLQKNEYNYIRFATIEEINSNMPIKINPNPDTIIRVLMTFKGLEKPIEVKEQELKTPERTGFVAVEWGGTEIK